MTEKEFRKLVSDLEVTRGTKEKINEVFENVKSLLFNNNQYFEYVDISKAGSLIKNTMLNDNMNIDFALIVKSKINKSFNLINKVIVNELINQLIVGIEEITKINDVVYNDKLNVISFNYQDYLINLYLYYEDDSIIEINKNNLITTEQKRYEFIEEANRDYSYFKNTIQIIKYYKAEQHIENISSYLLEVLLYYSLKEYCFDSRYEAYLNAFLRGLDDFINGKIIEVDHFMYEKLKINNEEKNKKTYTVLDVANPKNNIADDITEIKIAEYRKLKKVLSKLVDTKNNLKDMATGLVKLNVTPIKNKDNTFSWSYKIEDTILSANGGSYSNSLDDTYTAIYKALLKGLKAIIDNNLNRKQIQLIVPLANVLTDSNNLSAENKARQKNVLNFIEINQMKVNVI